MIIPTHWYRLSSEIKLQQGKVWPIVTWGWGHNEDEAKNSAKTRANKVIARILNEDFPDKYDYGTIPLREEIIDTLNQLGNQTNNVITRNKYGSLILNSSSLLFLDIDHKSSKNSIFSFLLGRKQNHSYDNQLQSIKKSLENFSDISFRIYRTASGFRVIATNKFFDPLSEETQKIMQATNTDQLYQKFCRTQESFRARLTPKPWRCSLPLPPHRYPRATEPAELDFSSWRDDYDIKIKNFATCKYLETIGKNETDPNLLEIINIHDKITRSNSDLPLA